MDLELCSSLIGNRLELASSMRDYMRPEPKADRCKSLRVDLLGHHVAMILRKAGGL